MVNFFNKMILCPDAIVGNYFEEGVYKEMRFDEYVKRITNEIPMPKTFVKYFKNRGYLVDNYYISPYMEC